MNTMNHYHLYVQEGENDSPEFCEAYGQDELEEMGMTLGVPQETSGYIYTVRDDGPKPECPFCQPEGAAV